MQVCCYGGKFRGGEVDSIEVHILESSWITMPPRSGNGYGPWYAYELPGLGGTCHIRRYSKALVISRESFPFSQE